MAHVEFGLEPQATYSPCTAQAISHQAGFHSPLDPGPLSHAAILWPDPHYSNSSSLALLWGLEQLVHADCGTHILDW